tara:strand:- start:15 stop:281 length:267 start_codon:yes stop_codon:yes gene_type:complete
MINKSEAVMSLRPDIEWTMVGDDVENITWHTQGVTPLTTAEVEAEMVRLEAAAVDADAAKAAARESAIAKLAALGLDSLEVQAIIGGI